MSLNPIEPHNYPRRALVCLVGLSPQVVTETIYALATQAEPFFPTELHLITTKTGAEKIEEVFCGAQNNPLLALQREYFGDRGISFDAQNHVHVIHRDGSALDDIANNQDNTAMADFILAVIRRLAKDETCAIHASIAGGRKTMSYYLGHVMSLVGRPQDRMSHVLLSPTEFERDPTFYFPPKVAKKYGGISSEQAQIDLVPVPFVRLINGLRDQLDDHNVGYSTLVEQAQKALIKPKLRLFDQRMTVQVHDVNIQLQTAQYAWYRYFAVLRKESANTGADWRVRFNATAKELPIGHGVFDQAIMNQSPKRDQFSERIQVHEVTSGNLQQIFSAIAKKFAQKVGPELARQVAIQGPPKGRKKNPEEQGAYGLSNVEPQDIEIIVG